MPARFLTDADRARLSTYPAEITADELNAHFTITADELVLVRRHRGEGNRLGFGLQLGTLRFLGFVPDELREAPAEAVAFVGSQIGAAPSSLAGYAERDQTRTEHQREVEAALGFRAVDADEMERLGEWLLQRALEHDKPTVLLQMTTEHLRAARRVRPGITILERLVGSARERAELETFRRVEPLLSAERRAAFDKLLEPEAAIHRTRLTWLRTGAVASTPTAILTELEKLAFLRGLGVDTWDLSQLNPNRRKFLAQVTRRSTNQALQRMSDERRYPAILSFLAESVPQITDGVVDLFDRALVGFNARARRERDEATLATSKATNEKVVFFEAIATIVLDDDVTDDKLRASIFACIPRERLEAARVEAGAVVRPIDDNYLDFFVKRYARIREFAPAFVGSLDLRANAAGAELVRAVEVLRQLNAEQKRRVPKDAPIGFVPARWRPYVLNDKGRIRRSYWELCLLSELRDALRSGDVWVAGSRRFANPETFLIAPEQWPAIQVEICAMLGTPTDGAARLAEHEEEFVRRLKHLDGVLAKRNEARVDDDTPVVQHHAVRVDDGRLVVPRLAAEDAPAEVDALGVLVSDRLPRVELAELLIEVDRWCGFTSTLTHAGGGATRSDDLATHLYAAILAQSCNFGLKTMAEIAELSYRGLAWANDWYIREETLKAATAAVVNFHHGLPLAKVWGGGGFSSSDGQRFHVDVKSTTAAANPRYFGRRRGLTALTWTSDQFSQYATKVVATTVRDATHVLDGILDNQADLDFEIEEHTTDTAGYTDLVFALFDLLGLQFAPRLRDVADTVLYRVAPLDGFLHLAPLFRGSIHRSAIVDRWDDMLRVAGSLKLGWVNASLLMSRFQAQPRRSALTKALEEYGRIAKTLFLLRYLGIEEYRRSIHRQLNKGESIHALRRFLSFAQRGHVRQRQLEDQTNQAACLTLVTNAVITWNTVYMAAALEQLRAEGVAINNAHVAHLWPTLSAHVNPYGRYRFDVLDASPTALRPLRIPTPRP